MKTKIFVALFVLVSIGLFGCHKEAGGETEIDSPDTTQLTGGWSALQYALVLEIVDQQGNNVLQYDEYHEIKDAQVEVLHVEKNQYLKNFLYNSPIEDISYLMCVAISDDVVYLPDAEEDAVLISNIKCKEIFGDDAAHIIEAKWEKKRSEPLMCTSFVFEGVTYYPEPKNGFLSAARVVINR